MSPTAGVVDGLLAGRYRLAARLGAGGSGEVWRARDERLDRDVAVKVLRRELADDQDVRARFRAEARAAGGLRHPGIAAVFDFAEDDESAWLVMELVDGAPLSDLLADGEPLSVDRTLDVVAQAAAALQAAHDGGVVHRDVKPGNLLLRHDGRLVVTDFGIAQAAGAAALTRTGQVVGTAAYLSPEQASGRPVSGATDLYALGVVAYECLSGHRPFERDDPVAVLLAHLQTPPPALPAEVPRPVADLVDSLLAKDPADRPAPARQVQHRAEALRRSPGHAAAATAVLPGPTAPAAAQQAAAPVRSAVRGLAGRPGQRRAVRVTAVALGLLALALGVRDATTQDPGAPADVRTPQPAGSAPAPPAPAPEQEPAIPPQDTSDPAQEPVQPQDGGQDGQQPAQQPVQEPVQPPEGGQGGQGQGGQGQGGQGQGDQGRGPQEQLERQQDKAEEQREKAEERQERRQDRGRGGDG